MSRNTSTLYNCHNATFQLAFYYEIGFGVRRDNEQVRLWLEKSLKNENDLQREKDALEPGVWDMRYHSGKVDSWLHQDFPMATDHVHEYRRTSSLAKIETDYIAVVQDLEQVLGVDHLMAIRQKEILSKIFEANGKYSEAEKVLTHIMSLSEKGGILADSSEWAVSIHQELARVLRV